MKDKIRDAVLTVALAIVVARAAIEVVEWVRFLAPAACPCQCEPGQGATGANYG